MAPSLFIPHPFCYIFAALLRPLIATAQIELLLAEEQFCHHLAAR
jgi:hypothetical protein